MARRWPRSLSLLRSERWCSPSVAFVSLIHLRSLQSLRSSLLCPVSTKLMNKRKKRKKKKKKCPLLIVDSPHFLPENPSDLEGSLRNFFNLGLLEENSRSMRVLKLMSFAVAVSSRKRLSDAVNEKYVKKTFFFSVCPLLSSFLCSQRFPFVEDPKSLCINVRFNENGHITVFHSRMEQAASPQPEFKFHFIWDCTFIFETYSNKLRTEVGILVSLFAFSFFLSDSEFGADQHHRV